jgi:hypothetical protein
MEEDFSLEFQCTESPVASVPKRPSGRAFVVAGAFDDWLVAIEGGQGGAGADARLVQIAERPVVA